MSIARTVLSANPNRRATCRAAALSHAWPTISSNRLLNGALLGNCSIFSALIPQFGQRTRYNSITTVVPYSKHGRSRTVVSSGEAKAEQVRSLVERGERLRFDDQMVRRRLATFDEVWKTTTIPQQAALLRQLIERVGYDARGDKVMVTYNLNGIREFCEERQSEGPLRRRDPAQAASAPGGGRLKKAAAPAPPRIPRITCLMALAIKFQEMIDRGEVKDYADLARLGLVTRVRVTQIMNLLLLAPSIQERLIDCRKSTASSQAPPRSAPASKPTTRRGSLIWVSSHWSTDSKCSFS
jgi:hypothetical protein